MENNILLLKSFVFNIKIDHAIIKSCRVTIMVKTKQNNQFLIKKFIAKGNRIVFPQSEIMILFLSIFLLNNQNYLFYLAT